MQTSTRSQEDMQVNVLYLLHTFSLQPKIINFKHTVSQVEAVVADFFNIMIW